MIDLWWTADPNVADTELSIAASTSELMVYSYMELSYSTLTHVYLSVVIDL